MVLSLQHSFGGSGYAKVGQDMDMSCAASTSVLPVNSLGYRFDNIDKAKQY
jgi:hypothetical protein